MNKLKSISGTWRGTYSYAPVEHIPNREPVPFTLKLTQGWFKRFKGTVTDGGPRGMPGVGAIEGRFSFPHIEFIKRMPVCHVATPDGRTISLREYLIEKGEAYDRDWPHMPIYYEGTFSGPNRAEGTWIIRAGPFSLGDGRAIQIHETRGCWSIDGKEQA